MDNDELTNNIIHLLSKADNRDDIIQEVCQNTGYSWSEAEELVRRIQEKNEGKIAKEQMPLLIGVAFFTFAAGLLLTVYGVVTIVTFVTANKGDWGPRDITSYIMPMIEKSADPVSALRPAIFPYFNLILGFILSPLSAIFFGILMLLGSLIGMRKVWSNILDWDE
jgi:hypothetical protein